MSQGRDDTKVSILVTVEARLQLHRVLDIILSPFVYV